MHTGQSELSSQAVTGATYRLGISQKRQVWEKIWHLSYLDKIAFLSKKYKDISKANSASALFTRYGLEQAFMLWT